MTLAFEDVYSKLVEVVTVAHVDDDNSLVQIWKVKFGHSFRSDFEHKVSRCGQDFEVEVWSLFCC